jgi:hypothetical protein
MPPQPARRAPHSLGARRDPAAPLDPADTIIVVARMEDLPVARTPAEATSCTECGEAVWLGYAVRIDAPFGRPVCTRCVLPRLGPDDVLTIPPEVRREVAAWLRKVGLD